MATSKPFWKTSEFWITTFVQVGSITFAVAGVVAAPVAGTLMVVSASAYAIARGIAKAGK